jgi:soluble lytic murein transglycosylase-like protein
MRFAHENDFDEWVDGWSDHYDVPAWVIKATIGTESSFRATAYDGSSRGLMQLELPTARGLGYQGPIGDDATHAGGLYEPETNIQLGTKYLAQLRDRYPGIDWDGIYSAYNLGHLSPHADGTYPNETNVNHWRANADYFNPGWRTLPDVGDGGPDPGNPSTPRTEPTK